MSKLEDALWEADAALKRLKPEQGRVARRNARQLMLKALRKARAALDAEFPNVPKERRTRRKSRSLKQRLRGMSRIGMSQMINLVGAGVGNAQFHVITDSAGKGATESLCYAPSWMVRALRAGIHEKLIAEAVRSQKKRRQINATLRLSGRGTP